MEESDEELLHRVCHSRDHVAYNRIYDRYVRLAWYTASRSGLNAEDCDDIAQETMLDLFKKSCEIKYVFGWVASAAHNKTVDLIRKRRTQQASGTVLSQISGKSNPHDGMGIFDDVRECVDHLDDVQRQVFVLVRFEELSRNEAAERLDIPVGTVNSRLARADDKVADCLERKWGTLTSRSNKPTDLNRGEQ